MAAQAATTARSYSNTVNIAGGTVIATNFFSVWCGTLAVNSGLLSTEWLDLEPSARLSFKSGTLQVGQAWSGTGAPFVIGDGSGAATLDMRNSGTGNLWFYNGLVVSSNGLLKGVGPVQGNVSVATGGGLSPGLTSLGQISIRGNLILSNGSTTYMKLNAASGSSDLISGISNVTYAGTLQLTNVEGELHDGNTFKLFGATNYAGLFAGVSPSSPGPDLKWNLNRLTVDGMLRVVASLPPPPAITGADLVGGNLVMSATGGTSYDPCVLLSSTDVTKPVAYWQRWMTNWFDSTGNIAYTNPVSPGEPQRYFRLLVE